MRLGVLSDIHGNIHALQAVLEAAKSLRIEKLVIAGDFVNYYYHPKEVMEALSVWEKFCIRGNHEEYLSIALQSDEFLQQHKKKYGSGLEVAIRDLSEAQIHELITFPTSLSLTFKEKHLFVFHGSPSDPNQYLYPDSSEEVFLKELARLPEKSVTVIGHSHYPFIKSFGSKIILNPGSVGQNREVGGFANWAWLDTENSDISIESTYYDVKPVIQEVLAKDPENQYLASILTRKKNESKRP